jgi:integrase
MDAELIVRNPATRVRLPKKPKRHMPTVLTPQEIGARAGEVRAQWRALVLVNAYGAMRWSEVVGLTIGSVDWGRRLISVTQTVVEAAGHLYREPTKTEAGRRTITLPGFVMEALAEHGTEMASRRLRADPSRRSACPAFYLLPNLAAGNGASRSARIQGPQPTLRHTRASLAVASGADLEHLKVRMGHESIATTSRFYLQVYEGPGCGDRPAPGGVGR